MLPLDAKTRPTLGLLISHLDGTYQVRFWQGLLRFCRRHDCDLVVFASRLWRGQSGSFRDQEVVYRLASARRIDALCVDTSAFRNQDDLDAYLRASPGLDAIPLVYSSIGGADRFPVMPDNRGGIRQALGHLVDVHGCRRLAFVGGPGDIEDARQRRAAFLEFVGERSLDVVPEWILEATFDTPSGREATRRILDGRAGLPQGIVYANDLMALGGLEVLKERGIAVPGQVRVTGFDNDEYSVHAEPSLSTVAQPIEAKAWVAGKILLDAVNGLPLRRPPEIRVKFLPRGSCGCGDAPPRHSYGTPRNADRLLLDSRHAITGISQVTEYLGSVLSLSDLSVQLGRLVPVLGLGPTYVSLHDEGADGDLPTPYGHLVCAVGADGTRQVDPAHPKRFLSHQLVPSWLRPNPARSELFVQALHKAERHFGFLVTEVGGEDPAVYVALRDHISEALFNIQHVQDLAESRGALEEALDRARESERQFRDLAQSLPVFLMETGPQGTVQYLNQTARDLLGVTERDVAEGLTLTEFLVPQAAPGFLGYRDLRLVSRHGRPVALLMRSVDLASRTPRTMWCGLDYRPILGSLTEVDARLLDEKGLTRREKQVLALELRGLVAKEIAAELGISLSTVKGHLGLVYRKLGVGSRDQLFKSLGRQLVAEHGRESLVFSLVSEVLKP